MTTATTIRHILDDIERQRPRRFIMCRWDAFSSQWVRFDDNRRTRHNPTRFFEPTIIAQKIRSLL